MWSFELDFQMIPLNTISSTNKKKCFCMHNLRVAKVFLDLDAFISCERIHMEEDQ
jgi:hypothetical protein